jgi:hypothetical protein
MAGVAPGAFTGLEQFAQDQGANISKMGRDMASAQQAQDQRRMKAEEDLAVSEQVTRFKTMSSQVVENKRKAYSAESGSDAEMSKFMPDVVSELKSWISDGQLDHSNPTVNARAKAEMYSHIDSLIPDLNKKSSEMIVGRSEARLGGAETVAHREAVNASDAWGMQEHVQNYAQEIGKAVESGMLDPGKGQERIRKFDEKASAGWFERMTAKNPEALFKAIMNPQDGDMLASVSGKEIASFLKGYKEQEGKTFEENSKALTREIFPLAAASRLSRTVLKEHFAPRLTPEDYNKIEGQLNQNEERVLNTIKRNREEDERVLKEDQKKIETGFWDKFYSNKGLVRGGLSSADEEAIRKLEPERYEKIKKALADAHDNGGIGNQERTEYWKMRLMQKSDALSSDEILKMNDLNWVQRQSLYQAKKSQTEFEKSASNPKHFSNDPNYKFYSGQIQEQLGVIKLSPFTNAAAIQLVSQAELAYRDEFNRVLNEKGSVSMEEAKQLMQGIVKTTRENLSFKSLAAGEVPRFSKAQDLLDAKESGNLTEKEFVKEYEKLKAWRALQGKNADGSDMTEGEGMKPTKEFKKRGKE